MNASPDMPAVEFLWADHRAEKRIFDFARDVARDCPRPPIGQACEIAWESVHLMECRSLMIRRGPVSEDLRFIRPHPDFMEFAILSYVREGRPILDDERYVAQLVRASIQAVLGAR